MNTFIRVARVIAPGAALAVVAVAAASGQAPRPGTGRAKNPLPLETARRGSFTATQGTWMSLDVSPDGGTIVFDLHLALAARMLIYSDSTTALLPLFIHEAQASGNFAPLAAQAEMISGQLEEALAIGMHNSGVCSEDLPFIDLDAVDRSALENSFLGQGVLDALSAICEVWPTGPVDDDLKHFGVDETTVGFEHQLRRDVRFAVTGVWRQWDNFTGGVIPGSTWTPYSRTNPLTNQPYTAYRWANRATTQPTLVTNYAAFRYVEPNKLRTCMGAYLPQGQQP